MNRRTLSSSGSSAANEFEQRVRCNTDQFHLLEEASNFRSVGLRRLRARGVGTRAGIGNDSVERIPASANIDQARLCPEREGQDLKRHFQGMESRLALENSSLRGIARPLLLYLSQETGESTYLAVRKNLQVVYIDKIESRKPILSWNPVGALRRSIALEPER